MQTSEEQHYTMLRYLDNELSELEEKAFIAEMAVNEQLQQAFDLELILREQGTTVGEILNQPGKESAMFEPADEHIARVKKLLTHQDSAPGKHTEARVINFWSKYKKQCIAAAIMLIVTSFVLFYNRSNNENKIVKKETAADTLIKQNALPEINKELIAQTITLPQIADENYSRYKGSDADPIEIGLYLQFYRNKKYSEVLNANPNDYQTKGSSNEDDEKAVNDYMHLYKALANLESNNPRTAISLLNKLVATTKPIDRIYYDSQWYLLIAYLKISDRVKSRELLLKIAKDKKNPNWKKGNRIAEQMKIHE